MITKSWCELFSKFSFIERVDIKGGYVYFFYILKGRERHKKISVRATKKSVIKLLKTIKDEIGVGIFGKGNCSEIFFA